MFVHVWVGVHKMHHGCGVTNQSPGTGKFPDITVTHLSTPTHTDYSHQPYITVSDISTL